ncbi:MAG: hypothetical protein V7785_09810 [Bermanella sp.]
MQINSTNYIALLGFADYCSEENIRMVQEVTLEIAQLGYGICMGNISGTFHWALEKMAEYQGESLLVLERELQQPVYGEVLLVDSVELKHQLIARMCVGAIVIGGAQGTAHIVKCVLDLAKPIAVVDGSGSLVNRLTYPAIKMVHSAGAACDYVLNTRH